MENTKTALKSSQPKTVLVRLMANPDALLKRGFAQRWQSAKNPKREWIKSSAILKSWVAEHSTSTATTLTMQEKRSPWASRSESILSLSWEWWFTMESTWVASERSLKIFQEFLILKLKPPSSSKSRKQKLMQLEWLMNLSTSGQLASRIQMKNIWSSQLLSTRLTRPAVTL